VTETALRPAGTQAPGLGSGRGGGDWADDDDGGSGGWWGWSEDPADDEPLYRASRLRRAVAIATTIAVVAGSMTLVAVVAVDPTAPQYTAGGVRLTTAEGALGTGSAAVRLVVTNTSSSPGRARCRVWLGDPNRPTTTVTVTTPRLPGGGSVVELAGVPGQVAAGTRVGASCGAAGG
jgi:hypothetical protein